MIRSRVGAALGAAVIMVCAMPQHAAAQAWIPPSTAKEVLLWPNGAPGSEGKTDEEKISPPAEKRGYTMLSSVHKPSVTVFQAPPETANGTGMIVLPGGGHQFLAIDIEGYNVAKYLNTLGVTAFVLKYRLANEKGSTYKIEGEGLADAQRAVKLVRSRAKEFGIDPARLGIMGFSTGGQLSAFTATRFDAGNPEATDPVERVSSRPDFVALIYPANIANITVTKEMPPAFLLSNYDDNNPTRAIPAVFLAMKAAGVNAELHVYASGGHGFGMREKPAAFPSTQTWFLRLQDWLGDRGLLKRP